MKNAIELRKLFFACMVVGSTVVLSSCSDDDDNTPVPPSVTDVNGEYSGKMLVTPMEAPKMNNTGETPVGADIAALVKSDTVYFDNFPITDLVAGIVGEEQAPAVVEKIGKVSYKVGYKGALNTAQDSIYMEFDPKPLTVSFEMGEGEEAETTTVEVTVSAVKKGSYELSSKKLVFDLNADKVTMGETEIPVFTPSEFAFKLNKK